MSEKWKQKILLIFPFAVLAAGMIFTATFFLHTYRQIAFEHTSALCETILANSPEAEPQLLAALKDYHSLTEQELRGNDYLEKYGYRVDDFCYDFPLDTVLFPILFFLVTACAFAAGIFLSRRKNRKRIADLTEYLEQVNIGAGGYRRRKTNIPICRTKYTKRSRCFIKQGKQPLPQRKNLQRTWLISHIN